MFTSVGLSCAELFDIALGVVVDVRLSGAVAALTTLFGLGRSRIQRLGVRGAFQRLFLVVTEHARVTADVAGRPHNRDLCLLRACWCCGLLRACWRCGLLRTFKPRLTRTNRTDRGYDEGAGRGQQ